MILTINGLRSNLDTTQEKIFTDPIVPSMNEVYARLLRISSILSWPSMHENTLDSFVMVSQTNSQGRCGGNRGRRRHPHCMYHEKLGLTHDRCYQLHGRPLSTTHMA